MSNCLLLVSLALSCCASPPLYQRTDDHLKSQVDENLIALSPTQTQELQRRSVPIVDLNAIPTEECGFFSLTDCDAQPPDTAPRCPLVDAPCADPSENGCKSYTLECFCNAYTPLACGWECNWWGWMYMEDWFTKTCPDTPPVDYSSLPACAKNCLSDGAFNYGCITQSKSCFCLHEEVFDCPSHCKDPADVEKIVDWYSSTCGTSYDVALSIVDDTYYSSSNSGSANRTAVIQTPKKYPLRWYEILIIATAVLTFVAAVGCGIAFYVLDRTWRRVFGYTEAGLAALASDKEVSLD